MTDSYYGQFAYRSDATGLDMTDAYSDNAYRADRIPTLPPGGARQNGSGFPTFALGTLPESGCTQYHESSVSLCSVVQK